MDQRCADWIILGQFRVSGIIAGKHILADSEDCALLEVLPSSTENEQTLSSIVKGLADSWFSNARSEEFMMQGTANENAVMNALKSKPFIDGIYECGIC